MLRLPCRILSAAAIAATSLLAQSRATVGPTDSHIEAIRFWSFGDVTRVAIETRGEYKITFDRLDSPPRLFFDLRGLRPPASRQRGIQTFPVGDRLIKQIRVAETEPGVTRVVIDLEVPAEFTSSQLINPDRLMIEVHPKLATTSQTLTERSQVGLRRVSDVPVMTGTPMDDTRPVKPRAEGTPAVEMPDVPAPDLFAKAPLKLNYDEDDALPKSTLVWDGVPQHRHRPATGTASAAPSRSTSAKSTAPQPAKAPAARDTKSQAASAERISPAKTGDTNRSLVRVFGLKVHKVVIDAGHGGHDTGTIGAKGLEEKDLVLDVALRLGKLIEKRLGADVIYTRSDDTFIPLEQRTKIANNEKADLFISIHANSSPAPSATGVETFYFNFTNDQHSLDLATRENASSASSIFELNDLLHKAVLNAKVEESREFAQKVQTSLHSMSVKMNTSSHNRGVKKAPFVVLIGATMPSILAEIGFVSNPHDERLLRRQDQRQKIAESLYKGVAAYAETLSHTQMARVSDDLD
jgi:N-acetylmuramoyl-L-alanine amidase